MSSKEKEEKINKREPTYSFFAQKQSFIFHKPIPEIKAEVEAKLKQNPYDLTQLLILAQIEYKYFVKENVAFSIYKQVLLIDPQNIDARIDIALMLLKKKGDGINQSKILLEECISLDPDYWRNYYVLALKYLYENEQLKGKGCLAEGFQKFPNESWIIIFYAQLLSEYNNNDKVTEKLIEEVIQNYPLDYETMLRIAYTYGTIQKPDLSEKYLYEAIALNPNSSKANNNLGYYYRFVKKEDEKCIKFCSKAIELDVNNEDSYYNLSICYTRQQNFDQSVSLLKKCIAVNGDYQYAYQDLAYISFTNQKNVKQTETVINKLLSRFPNNQYGGYFFSFLANYRNYNNNNENNNNMEFSPLDLEQVEGIHQKLLNNIKRRGPSYAFIDYNRITAIQNHLYKTQNNQEEFD